MKSREKKTEQAELTNNKTDKSWIKYRTLTKISAYRSTLSGRAIIHVNWIMFLKQNQLRTVNTQFSRHFWANRSDFLFFLFLFYSILSHNLGRSSGHHRWIRNNTFPSWPVFSCPSWAGKVHSCPIFDIAFPPLLLSASFYFSFHCAPYDVFAKPEDLETWPNHLSFRSLTRVRSSSYSPMADKIFLRTSSLVTWSLYEMFNSLR